MTSTALGRTTCTRDSYTGLDYGDQRYYASTYGRFNTADQYQAAANGASNPQDPTSWNHYGYVGGDPINRVDASGRDWCDFDNDLGEECLISGVPEISTHVLQQLASIGNLAAIIAANIAQAFAQQQAEQPTCNISVAESGTPISSRNVAGASLVNGSLFPDGPSTNQLGGHATQRGGVFLAVQLQAQLFGDTNSADWNALQTAAVTGTEQATARSPLRSVNITMPIDDPGALNTYRGTGAPDWTDGPGIARSYSADLNFAFTSRATNVNSQTSCSVTWSFTLLNEGATWSIKGLF